MIILMTASVINIPHLVFLAAGRLEKISKGFSVALPQYVDDKEGGRTRG